MRVSNALTIGGSLILATLSSPAFAGDLKLFVGNWVLNPGKSSFGPGAAPRSMRILTTDAGKGKVTSDIERISADGTKSEQVTTYTSDGKVYAPSLMLPQPAAAVTFVVTQAAPRMIVIETRSGGKVISKTRATVSADGKTQTGVTVSKTPDGKPMSNTMVFDRK
jgi:hypothetical protein